MFTAMIPFVYENLATLLSIRHVTCIKLQNLIDFYIENNYKAPPMNSRNSSLLVLSSAVFLVQNTLN